MQINAAVMPKNCENPLQKLKLWRIQAWSGFEGVEAPAIRKDSTDGREKRVNKKREAEAEQHS